MKWMAEYNYVNGKAMNIRGFESFEAFRDWMADEKPDKVEVWELGEPDGDAEELKHHTYVRAI